jgi:glycosyltransferase involved in cell wall biosynthesis
VVRTFSLVVPVYRNAASLDELIDEIGRVFDRLRIGLGIAAEAVFVVDGSPDDSHARLARGLPAASFPSKLVLHSRNFGSFAAIRTGLGVAGGDYIGVMSADLQEPAELQERFVELLVTGEYDVVVGSRSGRDDPWPTRLSSALFWRTYRRVVNASIPAGGVDVFACTRRFRDELLRLAESNTSLVGLLFWLGFRRAEVSYRRRPRRHGRSAWSLSRRVTYLLDSLFSFTDLPVRLLVGFGLLGLAVAAMGGTLVLATRLVGGIPVPGYAATIVTILFFGGLNALGLGIVGSYAWRGFENTKARPLAVVMNVASIPGRAVAVVVEGER